MGRSHATSTTIFSSFRRGFCSIVLQSWLGILRVSNFEVLTTSFQSCLLSYSVLSVLYYLHLDKIASVAAVVPSRCEKETVAVDVKSREKSIKVGHQFPSPLPSSIACRMVIRNCLKYFVKKEIHKLLDMSGLLSRNISRFRHLKNDPQDEKRRRRRGDKKLSIE